MNTRIYIRKRWAIGTILSVGFITLSIFLDTRKPQRPTTPSEATDLAEADSQQNGGSPTGGIDASPHAGSSTPKEQAIPTSPFAIQIEELLTPPVNNREFDEILVVLDKWAQSDPHAALAYVASLQSQLPQREIRQSLRPQDLMYGSVFKGWARSYPLAAWDYISSFPYEDRNREVGSWKEKHFFEQALAGWMESGPLDSIHAAIELIEHTTEMTHKLESLRGKHRAAFYQTATMTIAGRDLDYALTVLDTLKGGELRYATNAMTESIAKQWAESDPEKAADWALRQDIDNPVNVLAHATNTWGKSDPKAAMAWIDANTEGVVADLINQRSWNLFNLDDPAETRERAERYFMNHDLFPETIASVALSLAPHYPELAIELIQELPKDDPYHSFTTYPLKAEALVNLRMQDEAEAMTYIENLDTANEEDAQTLEYYQWLLKPSSPYLLAQSLQRDWRTTDWNSYTEFIPELDAFEFHPSGERMEEQLEQLVNAWGAIAPERVRFYLENQEVLSTERTAKLLIGLKGPQRANP